MLEPAPLHPHTGKDGENEHTAHFLWNLQQLSSSGTFWSIAAWGALVGGSGGLRLTLWTHHRHTCDFWVFESWHCQWPWEQPSQMPPRLSLPVLGVGVKGCPPHPLLSGPPWPHWAALSLGSSLFVAGHSGHQLHKMLSCFCAPSTETEALHFPPLLKAPGEESNSELGRLFIASPKVRLSSVAESGPWHTAGIKGMDYQPGLHVRAVLSTYSTSLFFGQATQGSVWCVSFLLLRDTAHQHPQPVRGLEQYSRPSSGVSHPDHARCEVGDSVPWIKSQIQTGSSLSQHREGPRARHPCMSKVITGQSSRCCVAFDHLQMGYWWFTYHPLTQNRLVDHLLCAMLFCKCRRCTQWTKHRSQPSWANIVEKILEFIDSDTLEGKCCHR